jgi:hypothetical protein
MVTLEFVNLVLDTLVKAVLLLGLVLSVYILFKVDKLVKKASRSVDSMEESARIIEETVKWGKILPWVGDD